MKQIIIALIGLIIVGAGVYYFNQTRDTYTTDEQTATDTTEMTDEDTIPTEPDEGIGDGAEPLTAVIEGEEVIGTSVDGNDVVAHHFGTGENEIVLIAGIHGGYSWNTALLGYELVDHFNENSSDIPEDVRLTIIPAVNPDGLAKVTGNTGSFVATDVSAIDAEKVAARFNSNDVDLNRNFDCDWQATGMWQSRTVSGGDEVFSEPESRAVRDYIESNEPVAVVAYYSAAGGVYSSNCHNGILAETRTITNLYANAANYGAHEEFDFYTITGDMVNWIASKNIPAISVLLSDHTHTEFSKNIDGVTALLNHYTDNE